MAMTLGVVSLGSVVGVGLRGVAWVEQGYMAREKERRRETERHENGEVKSPT
jgi:hypothetical protein